MTAKSFSLLLIASVAGPLLLAADRPDLNGSWQVDATKSDVHSHLPPGLTWDIQQTDDKIQITERVGDKNVSQLTCQTNGKDCVVKDAGHSAKASFYYNGPMLVELETMGDNVTKKRLRTADDGTLTVEVMHINPSSKDEKIVLTKSAAQRPVVANR